MSKKFSFTCVEEIIVKDCMTLHHCDFESEQTDMGSHEFLLSQDKSDLISIE